MLVEICPPLRVLHPQPASSASQTLVLVDLKQRKAAPIPDSYKEIIRKFEGDALET